MDHDTRRRNGEERYIKILLRYTKWRIRLAATLRIGKINIIYLFTSLFTYLFIYVEFQKCFFFLFEILNFNILTTKISLNSHGKPPLKS